MTARARTIAACHKDAERQARFQWPSPRTEKTMQMGNLMVAQFCADILKGGRNG